MSRKANPFEAMVVQLTSPLSQQGNAKRRLKKRYGMVFTLKRGGRVASGADVHKRALAMQANLLQVRGQGGGIVPLLLPKNTKEAQRLNRDLNAYDVELVRQRESTRFKTPRDQLRSVPFLSALISIYPAPEKSKLIDFAKWLHTELSKPASRATKFARIHAPALLSPIRSVSWLYRNLGKMSR